MIDVYAAEPHYIDHLEPIWSALPPDLRGRFGVASHLEDYAHCQGIDTTGGYDNRGRLMLSAGYRDFLHDRHDVKVLLEHGAGQTYSDLPGHPAHPGGEQRDVIDAFLVPSTRVAELCDGRGIVVGVPKLDLLHWWKDDIEFDVGRVAISFRWEYGLNPETTSAFYEYRATIEALAGDERFQLIGHSHPRIQHEAFPWYTRCGIPVVPRFEQVLWHAGLYVCDNSSTLFEFASMGRPVIVLNAAAYRKDVYHGLRFWDQVPGPQVDRPGDLADVITDVLVDRDAVVDSFSPVVKGVYDYTDGRATERAVAALAELHG